MANKVIMEFAQSRGLPTQGDTVIVQENGYLMSYGLISNGNANIYAVSVPIDAESLGKETLKEKLKELRKPFHKIAGVAYIKANGVIQLTVSGLSKKTVVAKYNQIAEILVAQLQQLNIMPRNTCKYCGLTNTDDIALDGVIGMPAHQRCKEEKAAEILQQVTHNEESGNAFLGLLGALIGGIVGCIPSFLTMHFANTIYAILFALIPLAAFLGYKLFKGILNASVPFIISIISLVCTVALVFFDYYTYLSLERGRAVSMAAVFRLVTSSQNIGLFLSDLLMPIIFCVLGIVFSWSAISQGNKKKRQEAEELRRTLGE